MGVVAAFSPHSPSPHISVPSPLLQDGHLVCLVHLSCCSRHRLEHRLSKAVHALSAAWVRLQLLAEAVLEQGAGLTEPQLAKEREGIVAIRDRLQQAQVSEGAACERGGGAS